MAPRAVLAGHGGGGAPDNGTQAAISAAVMMPIRLAQPGSTDTPPPRIVRGDGDRSEGSEFGDALDAADTELQSDGVGPLSRGLNHSKTLWYSPAWMPTPRIAERKAPTRSRLGPTSTEFHPYALADGQSSKPS